MTHRVFVEINTPVGVFSGFVTEELDSMEQAAEQRDAVQVILQDCSTFTIFSDTVPGAQITLTSDTIKNSVFNFMIVT